MMHLFYCFYSCSINDRHLPHPDDENFGRSFNIPDGIFEFISSSKKKRACYLKYFCFFRYCKIVDILSTIFYRIIARILAEHTYIAELYHFSHKEKCRQHHADFDGNGKVNQYCEQESSEQYNHVAPGSFCDRNKVFPFTHIIGYNHENPCQCSHWN